MIDILNDTVFTGIGFLAGVLTMEAVYSRRLKELENEIRELWRRLGGML